MNTRLSRVIRGCLVGASHLFNTARTWSARFLSLTAVLCAGLMVVNAQAAFKAVETFDSLNLTDVNGQNGWDSDPGIAKVVLDPSGGGNQVLEVLTESGELFKAASVPQGSTRMLFLRLRFEEHGRYSFGLSFASNPMEYIDFQPELGMAAATASDPGNDLRVANGSSTEIYDVLTALVPGTWYNVWVLVDNDLENYQVWLNSAPGGDAQAGDQLSNDAAETLFGFRTAPGTDLENFFIKTGGGDSPADGRFYLDDIYLETTDDVNLSNPQGIITRFLDVPIDHWAYSFIETIAKLGITSGCDETHYCPTDPVNRAQMAVFVEQGMRGGAYDPGPGVGNIFLDVPPGYWAGGWIEQLSMDGVTSGCGPTHYCPGSLTTRAEMAVFLLRAKYGMDYAPPTPVGVFNDVAVTYWAAGWIEQLAAEGITSGCGNGNYCPADPVNRDQMAVFLVRTFQLQ